MKVKLLRKNFKTVAQYIYRYELHGEWADFVRNLENSFELTDETLRPRRNKIKAKREQKVRETPPPIPAEAVLDDRHEKRHSRNSRYWNVAVHRGTPYIRTLCGSMGVDVVTTMEDQFVTCTNCLLPKHWAKLSGQEDSQEDHNKMGNQNPSKQLPIVPHFLSSSSSEM